MARLLVTGGAGFISANFVHHWAERHPGDRLVVLDALTYAGNLANLDGLEGRADYRFVEGDIVDQAGVEALLREEALDTIVHFAAETHVDRSIHGSGDFISTNLRGTHSLLEAARIVWLAGDGVSHRFHHVSTDEVYGSLAEDDPPFTEHTPYSPNSPYAASKAGSDHLVRAWHQTYGLETTITNCSNNYGPYQYPEKLIPLTIINLLHGRTLPIYGDGRQIRDWMHVSDHCRGIEQALEQGTAGGVYNIGGGQEHRNIDLVRGLCRVVDQLFEQHPGLAEKYPDAPPAKGDASDSLIRFVTDRPGHDRRYAIDFSHAASEIGYAPSVALEDGLRQTLDWYLAGRDWWLPLLGEDFRGWIERQYG